MGRMEAAARFRELGSALRKCREQAGLSGQVVAERTGWDKSKISRVESGHQQLTDVDVIHYLGACGVYLGTAGEYMALCRDAHRYRDYWLSGHGEHLEDSLTALIYHESTATSISNYEPLLIPGLLQTDEYARARISREQWRTEENIEFCVGARMARQQILHRPRSARFSFFVHERALRLVVGSPQVMHDQLLKLVLLTGLPHLEIRVVPDGERSEFGGSFLLLEFVEHQPIAYLDGQVAALFLEEREYVAGYRQLVPRISEVAMDEGQSREFAAALASEHDRGSAIRDVNGPVEEKQQ